MYAIRRVLPRTDITLMALTNLQTAILRHVVMSRQ